MRNSKIILFIGLTLFFVSLITIIFYQHYLGNIQSHQDLHYDVFVEMPLIIFLFFAVVFIPILEEFVYRGWILKNKKITIISFIGMVVFTYVTFNLYIAIILLLIFLYIYFKVNDDKRIIVLLFINCILFTLAHKSEFLEDFYGFFALTQIFGLSIIINYFGIKYGFRYSILIHILNNFIAVIFFSFLFNNNSLKIKADNYKVTIERDYSLFSTRGKNITTYLSYLTFDNDYFNDTVIYLDNVQNIIKYKIEHKGKSSNKIAHEKFIKIVKGFNIKLDTIYQNPYVFKVKDSIKFFNNQAKINGDSANFDFIHMRFFNDQIRSLFKIPLIANKNEKVKFIYFDRKNIIRYNFSKSKKENADIFIDKLFDVTGILLELDTNRTVPVIYIRA